MDESLDESAVQARPPAHALVEQSRTGENANLFGLGRSDVRQHVFLFARLGVRQRNQVGRESKGLVLRDIALGVDLASGVEPYELVIHDLVGRDAQSEGVAWPKCANRSVAVRGDRINLEPFNDRCAVWWVQ